MQDIYEALTEHQQRNGWSRRDLFQELHQWAQIFDSEFKLEVPELALEVDRLDRRRFGHFRYGHNGFGLRGEIAINELYLDTRPFWESLGTLLHEQLHAWQQAHGKPSPGNYHNEEFRKKAATLGLVVDRRGITQFVRPSRFTELLELHGASVPVLPAPTMAKVRGVSKLKKWSCKCPINVRVAAQEFQAQCLRCQSRFEQQD